MATALTSSFDPASGVASLLRSIKGNTKITPDVLEEIYNILFNPNVVPRDLRQNPVRSLFDIPKLNPVTAAGAAGGFSGGLMPSLSPLTNSLLQDDNP